VLLKGPSLANSPFVVERGIGPGYKFNTTMELYNVTGLFAWTFRMAKHGRR